MVSEGQIPHANGGTVLLFGPVQIRTEGLITTHFRSNRVPAMLAYLMLHRTGDVSREELADRLWPNLTPEAARNNLRVTLQYLKKTLEAHGLSRAIDLSDRSRISINRELLRSDVAEFGSLLRLTRAEDSDIGLLRRAVTLAKGPLLADLFDEWIEVLRADLTNDRIAAQCRLARRLLEDDPGQALQVARRAAGDSPFLDEPRELIAKALMRLGDFSAAVLELESFDQDLDAHINAGLSPELRVLLDEARYSRRVNGSRDLTGTIPNPFTKFFGRESELLHIRDWMADPGQRLLTLTGPGGIGKTRLAVESVSQSPPAWRVFWVNVADINRGDDLLDRICATVFPEHSQSGNAVARLKLGLQTKCVMYLDNLEQVPDAELRVIRDLLNAIPTLKVLATSRKTLGIRGERLLRVEPLADLDVVMNLFIDRATGVDPDFRVGENGTARLRELCQRLECIPLAIELAAARLVSTTLDELIAGMERRLDMLVSRRSQDDRHGALRVTIGWGFAHLPPEWRHAIEMFGLLRGDWSRELAAAVVGAGKAPAWTATALEVGIENSLISQCLSGTEIRFRMLECIRDYAAETVGPKEREPFERRLAEYYRERGTHIHSLAELEGEWPNLEFAIEILARYSETLPDFLSICECLLPLMRESRCGVTVLRILGGLTHCPPELRPRLDALLAALQLASSDFSASIESADRVLASTTDRGLRIRCLIIRSRAKVVMGDVRQAEADARLALAESEGETGRLRFEALQALAKVLYAEYQHEALAYVEQAVEVAKTLDEGCFIDAIDTLGCVQGRLGDSEAAEKSFMRVAELVSPSALVQQARLWSRLGYVRFVRSDFALARDRYEKALDLARASQDHWMITQILALLGDAFQRLGEFAKASETHAEGLRMRRITGERLGMATSLRGVARAHLAMGEFDRASAELEEAIQIGRELNDKPFLVTVLIPYARMLHDLGRTEEAQRAAREAIEECQMDSIQPELLDMPNMAEDVALAHELIA